VFTNGNRTQGSLRVIGRLAPGVTVAQAQAQMEGLAAELRETYPVKKNAGVYINVVPMHDTLVSDVRPAILALMGAVIFVLLIACANVANLLIAQAARRERDLAVRAALGASRGALVGQQLAESLLLAGFGAAGGVGLAQIGIGVLKQIGPATLPRLQSVEIDLRVLAFTAGMALLSALIFGLVPALRASRPDVVDVLRRTGRTAGLGAGRLRSGLVVVEVALSFVLLVGSGLMLRSMIALQRVNPGYDPRGVLTFLMPNIFVPQTEARAEFVRRMRAELAVLPGVESVAAANPLPLDGGTANMPWGTEAAASDPTQFQQATTHVVLPGYFETMRAPVLEGRTFRDDDNRPESNAVVIDHLLAAKAFPGQPATGRRLLLRLGGNEPTPFEVIGVVAHERHATLAADGREALFFTDGQRGFSVANRWVLRTSVDPASLSDAVKATVARINPRLALSDVQPMQALVDRVQAPTRFALSLTSVFAAIAAVLAVIGLYSVLAASVRQRTAEIGVRMAFGAERAAIFRLIVGRGLALAAVGIVIGAAAALGMTRAISSLLVGVRASDPATFATIGMVFLGVALAACGLPAYRASRLDATEALRAE
jgi:putative ABC transport system permease protein